MGIRRQSTRALKYLSLLLVGMLVIGLVATQTPWFRDWLRRTAMRQAERAIDGQLVIGRLEGTLFSGVTLRDVSIVQEGAPVVSIDRVRVSYGLGELLSDGRVVNELHVDRPVIRAVRTPTGWNLGRLLKPRRPSEPGAPRPTFSLPDIVVTDGLVTVEGVGAEPPASVPGRVSGLSFTGGVTSIADRLTIEVRALSLQADRPDLRIESLTGTFVNDADGWHFEKVALDTAESMLVVNGALTRDEADAPLSYDLEVRAERLSLPELGRFVPVVARYDLRPAITASVRGTLDALRLEVDVESEAGNATGPLVVDATGPTRGVAGTLDVEAVNLATWVEDEQAAGRITGAATFDLRFPSSTPDVAMDGTFEFEGPEASAYGYAATNVRADGSLRGRRINLNAAADAYGGRATTRGTIDRAGPARREVTLSLAGRVDDVDLRALPESVPVPDLDSSLSGTYTVEGPISQLRATANLDASTVEGAQLASGFTGVFERLPQGFGFQASGDVEGLDLQRLGQALETPALQQERYAGVVNGSVTVQGTKLADEPVSLTATGTLRDTRLFDGRVDAMRVEVAMANETLDVKATGRVDGYDLAALSGVEALTGTLSGEVDTDVTFTSLDTVSIDTVRVDGTVTLEQPTLLDVPFEQVIADMRLDQGVMDVRSLKGRGEGFTVTGEGTLALGSTGTSDFRYEIEADSLVQPAKVADLPLTGAATSQGTISGPRDAFRVSGTLTGTDMAYDETVSAARATAQYDVAIPDLDPERLVVETDVDAGAVVVAGLPLTTVTGHVTYQPGELAFTTTAQDEVRTLEATGTMALDADGQDLRLTDVSLARDDVRWTLAPGTEAAMRITEQAVTLQPTQLVSGAQAIDLEGQVAIDATASNTLTVTATSVDVGDALTLAGQTLDADGLATLDARIGGTRAVPTASGHLTVTQGRFRELDIALIEATVEDNGRFAEVDALIRQSDLAYLTAKGVVPRTLFEDQSDGDPGAANADDRLDLEIHSTSIDLRLANGLTERVQELSGTAQLDVRLTNTGRVPVVDGEVTIENAAFLVSATGVTYQQVNGNFDFSDDRVIVNRLTAESSPGREISVTGEVGLRNARKGEVALKVEGDSVRVLDNDLGQISLDASLSVGGSLAAPVVEGDLEVTSGRLEIDNVLPRFASGAYDTKADYQGIPTYAEDDALPVVPNILEPTPEERLAETAADETARASLAPTFVYEDMAMNVRVRIPDNLVLRGRNVEVARNAIGDVNVTMGGDFRVAKPAGETLVLIGAVNTVRGTYSYQGRRFDIARDGQVLFRGDGTTNPSLDITAERVIQGVEARVRIQGTAEEPTLTLSSDPPLDQADVLALIVFNQPVNQLGTGQQNSLAQRAGGVAAGFAVSPIAQALGNTLDLDLFDVETTDPSGRVNPALVVGQQVNQDLFVKFRQQFGNQQVSQFLLEYRLADFLRLQANFADGEGLARANRSLTQRVERYGTDLVFYFAF